MSFLVPQNGLGDATTKGKGKEEGGMTEHQDQVDLAVKRDTPLATCSTLLDIEPKMP